MGTRTSEDENIQGRRYPKILGEDVRRMGISLKGLKLVKQQNDLSF